MTRAFRYRLYPTAAQERVLRRWLVLCCELYNAAREERRWAWQRGSSVTYFGQSAQLSAVRRDRPEFADVPIVVLRGSLKRIDRAYADFFRRCREGETPGYPRYKGVGRFRTIMIDDLGQRPIVVAGGKRIVLHGVGKIKFKQHRPIQGRPKAVRIKLDATGRWFVSLSCTDVPPRLRATTGRAVGIDLGVITFAATSDGDLIEPHRPLRDNGIRLARVQRRLAKRKRGGGRWRIAKQAVARQHAHIANIRREWHITLARWFVERYDTICVEDLTILWLVRSHLAGAIRDMGWVGFLHWLRVKAEEAGREVIAVAPHGTSQTCSACAEVVSKPLSERIHRCECGLVLDRDVNAARNILRLGRSQQGAAPAVGGRRRSVKTKKPGRYPHMIPL